MMFARTSMSDAPLEWLQFEKALAAPGDSLKRAD